jgi:hypothetical protein
MSPDDELLLEYLQQLDERPCPVRRHIDDFVAGSLPSAVASEVRAHLRECIPCLSALARLQSLHESESPHAGNASVDIRGRARWLAGFLRVPTAWPARLGLIAVACVLVFIGFGLGAATRALVGRPSGISSAPPPKPAYRPDSSHALGIVPGIKQASEQHFQEAMKHYADPDFARRAVPLLRAAVEADETNDRAQFWLGVALLLGGEGPAAIAPLQAAQRLAPADAQVKAYLIYAYLETGAFDHAQTLQRELLRSSER